MSLTADGPVLPLPVAARQTWPSSPILWQMFQRQVGVLYALSVREMEGQYGRFRFGYVWGLADPLLHVAVLLFVHVIIRRMGGNLHDMPPATFVILGVLPFLLFIKTFMNVGHILHSNQFLMILPRVTPLDLMLARALTELCTHVVPFILFMAIAIYFEHTWPPRHPIEVVVVFLSAWVLGFGFGTTFSAFQQLVPEVANFNLVFQRVFFWTGGVFFVVDQFPTWMWPYLLINPLLHVTELMRSAWFSSYVSPIASPAYVAICAIVTLLIGLTTERLMRRVHA